MNSRVFHSFYKDINAVTIESDSLRIQFLPEYGGKMASFFSKESCREFLVQAPGSEYKVLRYDGDYVAAECSGFDDMFPSIDRAGYPAYPWKGIEIPDHGEVCSLKWECEIRDGALYMAVNGVRFPYRFEKWIRFHTENSLNISYKVTNLSSYDMDFIWAAHPMINMDGGGEILLPFKQQEAKLMFSSDTGLGDSGDLILWPETTGIDGSRLDLREATPGDEDGRTYKYYFTEKIPEGLCAFRYKSDGTVLKLSFPPDKVPYLGIWVNEGSFKNYWNVAFEMCTGLYDRPDIAKRYNCNSVLKAKSEYTWFLDFQVVMKGVSKWEM
jgi:galactose mutarotase-like enzyme